MSKEKAEKVVRPFVDFLKELRKGIVADELSQSLHELIEAVETTGKPGTLTLTIKVDRQARTDMLITSDKVKVSLPELERDSALWFKDRNGNLTRSNPDQIAFDSMTVVKPAVGQ